MVQEGKCIKIAICSELFFSPKWWLFLGSMYMFFFFTILHVWFQRSKMQLMQSLLKSTDVYWACISKLMLCIAPCFFFFFVSLLEADWWEFSIYQDKLSS